MLFALALPALIMVVVGGIDINRVSTAKVGLQDALDAGALAAARSPYTNAADIQRVGMDAFRTRQIGELSGGQRKRVFLARSLAQEGRIILLDEPFTGVDAKTEAAIIELLRELRTAGHLMLVSTHNLGSVPEFCDQCVLVNRTVLAAGPVAEVFTQANLERAFGGVLRHLNLGAPPERVAA